MEVRWLEDFMALARTQHFSRAAEMQHVSQPTFSRRIKLLEEAMGSTLINRQTLPLSLTPAGQVFLEMCERITRDVRDTRERITSLEADAATRISVGSTQGLFSHFFSGWVERTGMRDRIEINLKSTNWVGEDFLDALDNGDVDMVLCYWHEDLPWRSRLNADRYEWLTLEQERVTPFTISQDNGEPRFSLPGTQEQPVPVIAYHARGFLKSAILAHLARTQPQAHLLPLNENSHSASVKALLKQGFGMGWLPYRMGEKSEHFGQLVRAGDERWDVFVDIRLIRLRQPRSEDTLTLWNELVNQYV
ncbi:LysR family transcriptional regulator [Marinobacter bohaiensis]|uniref:LysR family transcriptional regulator n=1 Tax=Marinobacter bohaiensis TaxID=2201898 RepID=UPI000DAD8943|nr:LysR family transcriptional regulator [Marinobacter bohaiensis]